MNCKLKPKPNIAIFGAGMVASSHLDGILKTDLANVLWLADPDRHILRQKLAKYNIPDGAADYRNILKDDRRYQSMTAEEIYNSLGQDIQ